VLKDEALDDLGETLLKTDGPSFDSGLFESPPFVQTFGKVCPLTPDFWKGRPFVGLSGKGALLAKFLEKPHLVELLKVRV
jgi:hypothetical protein